MQSTLLKLSSNSTSINMDFDLAFSAFRRICQGKGIKLSSPTTSPTIIAVDA
jgi:hypothetical protein